MLPVFFTPENNSGCFLLEMQIAVPLDPQETNGHAAPDKHMHLQMLSQVRTCSKGEDPQGRHRYHIFYHVHDSKIRLLPFLSLQSTCCTCDLSPSQCCRCLGKAAEFAQDGIMHFEPYPCEPHAHGNTACILLGDWKFPSSKYGWLLQHTGDCTAFHVHSLYGLAVQRTSFLTMKRPTGGSRRKAKMARDEAPQPVPSPTTAQRQLMPFFRHNSARLPARNSAR